ncbi:MAG: hypothetical protein U0Q12_00655 [Vicinamibacterales bacterium]
MTCRRFKDATILAAVWATSSAPSAQTSSWRPTVMGTQGMVAAGHPLAAEVGMRVLKNGGNAVDAAIAAWAIQGQVELRDGASAPTCLPSSIWRRRTR